MRQRQANDERVFGLVLRQWSRTIRDRMEVSSEWNTINEDSDLMGLLRLIRESLYT